jgi:uncharacterized membrane protein YgcG
MPRLALIVLLALGVAALAAPPALAGPMVDRAAAQLRADPVFVAEGAERAISNAEASRLRGRIADADAGPMYIAILPAAARGEAGGSADGVLEQLINTLRQDGTYAVVVGDQFRAASNALPRGEAGRLATEAFEEHRGDGVTATLLAFVDRVGAARAAGPAGAPDDGSDGGGVFPILVPILAVGGIGFFLFRRARRRRADDADFAEVKNAAQEDLLALAEDIRALDLDVEMPNVSEEAKSDYERALSMYEQADRQLDRAHRPDDLEAVSSAVAEGRWAIASVKARLEGKSPPERRPPCFFDPRHGPSSRDVEWAPPWGTPRLVPACEADAQRIERGLEPVTREVMVGGQRTPYWNAPPAYGPWAGGYFGGFGGLFPGLLIGSMLGSAFSAPVVYADPGYGDGGDPGGGDGGGDFGDFGGGDFGGGGGDFGGGDF